MFLLNFNNFLNNLWYFNYSWEKNELIELSKEGFDKLDLNSESWISSFEFSDFIQKTIEL